MRKKLFVGAFIIIFLAGLIYMVVINTVFNKNEQIISEYIPEVEISDEELRKTVVTLYFISIEDNTIKSEARLIDSKELLRDPYTALIGMLLKGPKDSKLKSIIPEGTQVLGTKLNKNCVTINLSKEFIENAPEDVNEKSNMIYMIINTLTELKEVESIRFLIEGEEVEGFKEEAIKLNNEFVRKKD